MLGPGVRCSIFLNLVAKGMFVASCQSWPVLRWTKWRLFHVVQPCPVPLDDPEEQALAQWLRLSWRTTALFPLPDPGLDNGGRPHPQPRPAVLGDLLTGDGAVALRYAKEQLASPCGDWAVNSRHVATSGFAALKGTVIDSLAPNLVWGLTWWGTKPMRWPWGRRQRDGA